jgi:hypothetical protein
MICCIGAFGWGTVMSGKEHEQDHSDESNSKGLRIELGGLPLPLKRTGRALDRLLAVPVEKLGDWVEQSLTHNIDEHVAAVEGRARKQKRVSDQETIFSLNELAAMREWASKAGLYDASDPQMAAAWRAALDKLLSKDRSAEELISSLTAMPASSVRIFVERYGKPRKFGRHPRRLALLPAEAAKQLIAAKLVRRVGAISAGLVLFFLALAISALSLKPPYDHHGLDWFEMLTTMSVEKVFDNLILYFSGRSIMFWLFVIPVVATFLFWVHHLCVLTARGGEFIVKYSDYLHSMAATATLDAAATSELSDVVPASDAALNVPQKRRRSSKRATPES